MLGDPPRVRRVLARLAEEAEEVSTEAGIIRVLPGDRLGFLLAVVAGERGEQRDRELLLLVVELADLDAGPLAAGEDFARALGGVERSAASFRCSEVSDA